MRRLIGRRPSALVRCRLVSVSWLVAEDQVLDVVDLARRAGFSVAVSPTVQAAPLGALRASAGGLEGGSAAGGPAGA